MTSSRMIPQHATRGELLVANSLTSEDEPIRLIREFSNQAVDKKTSIMILLCLREEQLLSIVVHLDKGTYPYHLRLPLLSQLQLLILPKTLALSWNVARVPLICEVALAAITLPHQTIYTTKMSNKNPRLQNLIRTKKITMVCSKNRPPKCNNLSMISKGLNKNATITIWANNSKWCSSPPADSHSNRERKSFSTIQIVTVKSRKMAQDITTQMTCMGNRIWISTIVTSHLAKVGQT